MNTGKLGVLLALVACLVPSISRATIYTQYKGSDGGDFWSAANWKDGVPDEAGYVARLNSEIATPCAIVLTNAPGAKFDYLEVTSGEWTLRLPDTYSFGGDWTNCGVRVRAGAKLVIAGGIITNTSFQASGGGQIVAVISSKPGAYALERAKNAGIEGFVLNRKEFDSNKAMTVALVELLKTLNIDLVVLAGCMVTLMYGLVVLCEKLFLLDFRFIWPFFKTFSVARFGQFLVYLPFFALFFVLNNSKIFAGMRTEATYAPGARGFFSCWWRSALLMIGGVLVIVLIEYIPFFMGIGPGADLLFSSTFGGPFMSILIVFVPQVLVFSLLCTYIYRRTGNVYTGAFTVASMAAWIITGGSAML